MEYNTARKNLHSMMELLQDAGYKIKDLYYTDYKDKTTTLFDSVQGLFDDVFDKEIEAELAEENAYWAKADYEYEKWRDEQ